MPWANFPRMSAVAGATNKRSMRCATAICSIALSTFAGAASAALNMSVMTFWPVSAANVSGVINSCAARVITTCTASFSCCKRRTSSAALYAATPPVTPRAIFIAPAAASYFRRFPSLSLSSEPSTASVVSYSSRPLCNSSSAMRVVFRACGLSTSGRPPIINCRARLAATTTYANWLSGASRETAISRSASKRLQNFSNSLFVPRHPATRPERDRLSFPSGAFEVVIYHRKVVAAVVQHLLSRPLEAPRDFIFGSLAARPNAVFEFRPRRRKHENGNSPGQLLLHLQRALHIDLEYEIFFLRERFLERFPRRPVPIFAEYLSVLEKIAPRHHPLELSLSNKIVPSAVGFRLARRPRGARNGQDRPGKLQNLFHQRGLPGAGRPRHDQYQRLASVHSMFCTCSPNFSLSDLISKR